MMVEKIMREYEKIRSEKEAERFENIRRIYKSFPEIKSVDEEINRLGSENVKRIIENPKKTSEFNSEFRKKLENLNKKRLEITEKNNIDPKFDKVKYECEKCSDTGFTPDKKRCECYKKRVADYCYARSNLSGMFEGEGFDTFSLDYYSKEGNGKLTPYENMKKIYCRAMNFCKNFDNEKKGLLFYGNTGLGKTFLSVCIAKYLINEGHAVIYISAPRLFMIYEDYRFKRLDDIDIIDDIYSADLLIIDDLGTENQNKNNAALLSDIMNERLYRGKKMIINTNYNMNSLTDLYSARFTSRIYEFFLIYGFYGEDIRIEKMKNR